jgi:uncharacterized protein (TIGR02145 family)
MFLQVKRSKLLSVAGIAALLVLVSGSGFVATSQTSGSFTDPRDGQKYRTVKIGSKTWMAQNLNYKTKDSWCYDDNNSNCNKYGRLYDWSTAEEVCPKGWVLPSYEDFADLFKAVGGIEVAGTKLKSGFGWIYEGRDLEEITGGTDDYGWSGLPGGSRMKGKYEYIHQVGTWWGATNIGMGKSYVVSTVNGAKEMKNFSGDVFDGNSVRCIQH